MRARARPVRLLEPRGKQRACCVVCARVPDLCVSPEPRGKQRAGCVVCVRAPARLTCASLLPLGSPGEQLCAAFRRAEAGAAPRTGDALMPDTGAAAPHSCVLCRVRCHHDSGGSKSIYIGYFFTNTFVSDNEKKKNRVEETRRVDGRLSRPRAWTAMLLLYSSLKKIMFP